RGHDLSIFPTDREEPETSAVPGPRRLTERFYRPLTRSVDAHIRHQWPPKFTPPPAGHWVIIQPWEYGSLPRSWIAPMSRDVDEIWVPSHFVRECYLKSEIPADRVFVVPNGVDPARFAHSAKPLLLKTTKRFKFLFVGGTIWRKGIDVLLQAYARA